MSVKRAPIKLGANVRVTRCYAHGLSSHTCYRNQIGTVIWTNGRLWQVQFSPPIRPGLALDKPYFTRAQLVEVA